MRTFLLGCLLLLQATYVSAQKPTKLPEFGKVDKSDLEMKECSFDKGAEAMVLFTEGESFFRINLNSVSLPIFEQTAMHVRIKIFNKKGFDKANVRIRYPSVRNGVVLKSLSAQTYNLDASGNTVVSKVDKSTIFDKTINSRYNEKIFAFPDVKEGSVIEYKYVLDGYSENSWYFQKDIPVKYSRFIIDFPDELMISVIPSVSLPMARGEKKESVGTYSWYVMENLPALRDEEYMTCREDYLQKLKFKPTALNLPDMPRINLLKTWPGIVRDLMEDEDFGKQLKRNIPRTSDLDAMIVPVTDPYTRMCIIHKYVRNNMVWNNYDNIWALEGVRSAWKDKKGTSGEINLILINLLKDAGLKAHPVMVSTRENGIINVGDPGYYQFNKVMAYVEIGRKNYVLDATEKFTPSHIVPFEVMASEGLIIEKPESYEWGWKVLWDEEHSKKTVVQVMANIDKNGTIKGNGMVNSYEYEKINKLPMLKTGKDQLMNALKTNPDLRIDSFSVADADNDSLPLLETFEFSMPVVSSGEYNYFSANLFAGLNKNPFIEEERTSDIFFGTKQDCTISATFVLPEGYRLEAVPKNLKLITPDTGIVFKRYCSYNNGLLTVDISVQFKKPFYTPDHYPELKEFYKQMFNFLDEKFVYRKN